MARTKRTQKRDTKMARNSAKNWSASKHAWLYKSVRVNVMLLIAVVIGFAAAGTYFVVYAHAYSTGVTCTHHIYGASGTGYDSYGYCVSQLKKDYGLLNDRTNWTFTYENPNYLGWTFVTTANTKHFQNNWGISVDGVVGPVTWNRMCTSLHNHGMTDAWYNSGCNN